MERRMCVAEGCCERCRMKKKKPRKTSNVVLALLGMFVLVFVAAMVVTFWVHGAVPDTLIQYVLGAGGVEVLALAGIKLSKVITGEKTKEEEQP